MDDTRKRLDQHLTAALSRLRQLGGSGAIGDNSPFADEVDGIQASETREISFATREKVVERVKRLSAALDRLKDGEYGMCVECAGQISRARLRAVPEVQTCIRCQAGIEQLGSAYMTKVQ